MTFSLDSASNFSPMVDSLLKVLVVTSAILTVAVWGLMIFFCIKYRKGSKASRANAPLKSTPMEITLASLIFLFGLGLFIFAAKVFYQMYVPPASSIEIDVIAKQWMWVFHDARGPDQINSFKVPLNQPVRLVMTSEDVIHSFFIPAFRVKQDILPGRYTSLWFQPTKLGRFEVLCSQYCGLSHSQMRAFVEVISAEDYAAFVTKKNMAESDIARGAQIYNDKGCASCHDSNDMIGPSLQNIYGTSVKLNDGKNVLVDDNYLRRAILTPNSEIVQGFDPVMPTFQGQLSEQELILLINYIKSPTK